MATVTSGVVVPATLAFIWGGALAFMPQLSTSSKDVSENVKLICSTATIHRGKAFERMLNEHRDASLLNNAESDATSIYTRTVQDTDRLAADQATARFLSRWCDRVRMVLYVSLAAAPLAILLLALGRAEESMVLWALLGLAVLQTVMAFTMSRMARRISDIAESPLIVVGKT